MKTKPKFEVWDFLVAFGLISLVFGIGQLSVAAAWIFGGVVLILFGTRGSRTWGS